MVRAKNQQGDRCPDSGTAFDVAVVSDPPFEIVIHTASPFHYNVTDVKKDLLDPGKGASTPIAQAMSDEFSRYRYDWYLESCQEKCACRHKSCDHLLFRCHNRPKKNRWQKLLRGNRNLRLICILARRVQADWNPITEVEALENPTNGYRASKTFAVST